MVARRAKVEARGRAAGAASGLADRSPTELGSDGERAAASGESGSGTTQRELRPPRQRGRVDDKDCQPARA